MKLRVIPDLEFDVDAVTQKFAWIGRTSSGKTFACKRFVEQLLRVGAQVIVVDTMGVWYGLRQGPKGFDIPVIGGLYGDIPLEPTAGLLVAEVVVSSGSSMVLDVSQMTDGQRARFMEAFGRRLFELRKEHPAAMHIVLDEAQDVVPQNIQPNENMMLHEWVRITKQGRALGLGLSLTSQRPQEINKKALNQTECVFAFQLTGAQERKALEYWLSDKGLDTKLSHELPKLEVGVPFVWSPQWLKVARVMGRVLPIDSADTSQTPRLGEKSRRSIDMKPIDLRALRLSMSEMVEKAKDSDPVALRKRIKELEARLDGEEPESPKTVEPELIDELIRLARSRDAQTDDGLMKCVGIVIDVEEKLRELHRMLDATRGPNNESLITTIESLGDPETKPRPRKAKHVAQQTTEEPAAERKTRTSVPPEAPVGDLPAGEAAVLRGAFMYAERGITVPTLTAMTGYRAGYIGQCIKALVAKSLLSRPSPGRAAITDAGKALIPRGTKPYPRGKKLIEFLIETLPEGESKVLAFVAKQRDMVKSSDVQVGNYAPGYIGQCIKALVMRRALARPAAGFVSVHPEVYA